MEKKNGSGEKWGGRSLNAYTHFSLFQLPRTSQRGSLISFFWQLKRPFPTRKIDLIWFDYIRINIRSKRIWVGGSGIGLGYRDWEPEWVEIAITILRSTSAFVPLERRRFDSATSRLRLLVTAPSTATIARPINPSDSRFEDSSLLFIYLFFWIRLCLVAEKIWRKVESLYGWRIVEFDCVIAYMVLMMDKIRIRTLGG